MRILEAAGHPDHTVEQFDSTGFHVGRLGVSLHSVIVCLDPGGRIGRHPAVVAQALLPLSGTARVSGADGAVCEVLPGQLALWVAGEEHETSTRDGLVALVLEGSALADAFEPDA